MSGISSLTAIGNGLSANDGTGDTLRAGADKINNNNTAIATAVNNLASQIDSIIAVTSSAFAPAAWVKSGRSQQFRAPTFRQNSIVAIKPRIDYPELIVYTPISLNGIDWGRWFISNRFNPSNTGAIRVLACSLAKLYKSSSVAPLPSNLTTATQAVDPASTRATADATRSGGWSAPATVSGWPDLTYANTSGATAVYTMTGVSRIAMRLWGVESGGGVATIKIKSAGVEISSGYYTVPLDPGSGERRVDIRPSGGQTIAGLNIVTLATGLPLGDYTVEIGYSSASPASGRVYDGGMYGYTGLPKTPMGRMGTWDDNTVGSRTGSYAKAWGSAAIYAVTGTKVVWKCAKKSNACIAAVHVYDAGTGVEIDSGKYIIASNQVDTYASGSGSVVSVVIADGLPAAQYYVVVESTHTKNDSSTGYYLYDFGMAALNTSLPGTPGVDAFDDLGWPANPGTTTQFVNVLLGGGSELELAIKACKPSESVSLSDFCGGYHGHETAPTGVTFLFDGLDAGYAEAAAGTQWVCSAVDIACDTTLLFPSDSTPWAAVNYSLHFDKIGYTSNVTRTLTTDTKIVQDYTMMVTVPNTAPGNNGVSGGFSQLWATPDQATSHTYTAWDDGMYGIDSQITFGLWGNADYVVTGECLNTGEINNVYNDPIYAGTQSLSFVQDRADKFVKWYNRAFAGNGTTGVIVPSGNAYTAIKRYSVFRSTT
jgi:hypothetical protein